jgi:hypothetical protein
LRAERPNAQKRPMWILCRRQRISLERLGERSDFEGANKIPEREVDN